MKLRAKHIAEIMQLSNSTISPVLDSWALAKFNHFNYYDITDEFIYLLAQRLGQKTRDYSSNIKLLEIWKRKQDKLAR